MENVGGRIEVSPTFNQWIDADVTDLFGDLIHELVKRKN